eukprot:14550339-Ditylum_brightwellii.AAC.1
MSQIDLLHIGGQIKPSNTIPGLLLETITVSPPKPEADNPLPKELALPYKEKLEKWVEYARKLVGQLTDLKKKGNVDPNHYLLKGKDVLKALTIAHMKLAVASSRL